MITKVRLLVAGLVIVLIGVGVLGAFLLTNDAGTSEAVVEVDASERFVSERLEDWVSFSDAVVRARVIGEREVGGTPAEEAADRDVGVDVVGRNVTVKVSDVLWQRADGAVPPPELEFADLGWSTVDGRKRRFVIDGAHRLDVGEEYVFPIVWIGEEKAWGPLSYSAVFVVSGDTLVGPPAGLSEANRALKGSSVERGKAILRAVRPYPGLAGLTATQRMATIHGRSQDAPHGQTVTTAHRSFVLLSAARMPLLRTS